MLTEDNTDIDVFTTALVEIEGIMNRRPLTYASSDIRDFEVLTPAHFLYPGVIFHSSINILPPSPPGGDALRYSFQKARELIDRFWLRWSHEYLTTLQKRQKWHKSTPDLYKGQLVIMIDENLSRDQWRLAIVETVKSDGAHVRAVTVRTACGKLFDRHCSKLVALEMET